MYATHGSPSSAFAAIARRIGAQRVPGLALPARHDARAPAARPPRRPTRRCRRSGSPRPRAALLRRSVSRKHELPPSIRMSPGSRCGFEVRDGAVDRRRRPAPSSGRGAAASSIAISAVGRRRQLDVPARGRPGDERLRLGGVEVVAGDAEPVALHVERQVARPSRRGRRRRCHSCMSQLRAGGRPAAPTAVQHLPGARHHAACPRPRVPATRRAGRSAGSR